MSDVDRLREALLCALDELMAVVGLPQDVNARYGPRKVVVEPLVDRERVPASSWRAAVFATDVLAVGLELLDADALVTIEEGLALMSERSGGASA